MFSLILINFIFLKLYIFINASSKLESVTYIGCYNNINDIEIDYTPIFNSNESDALVTTCLKLCSFNDFRISLVNYPNYCYCDNTYLKFNKLSDSNCGSTCENYPCGGFNSFSVYLLSYEIQLTPEIDYDPCISNPCRNYGECISIIDNIGNFNNFICKCHSQFIGPFCELLNFCSESELMCLNGGSCINLYNGHKCLCADSFTGSYCEIRMETEIEKYYTKNICLESINKCQNGGKCIQLSNSSFECECTANYSGRFCEILNICSLKPCKNDGRCIFYSPSKFECNCTNEYFGRVCEFINPCHPKPCKNNGQCIHRFLNSDNNPDYVCSCNGNFVGKNCDTCAPGYTGNKCDKCIDGFYGTKCDKLIDRCSKNFCKNGLCKLIQGSYSCECFKGWTGLHCDVPTCVLHPCLNNGICSTIYNNETHVTENICLCIGDYYGEKCEMKYSSPCHLHFNPCGIYEKCLVDHNKPFYKCINISNIRSCKTEKSLCNEQSECFIATESNLTILCKCKTENILNNLNQNIKCDYLIELSPPLHLNSSDTDDALKFNSTHQNLGSYKKGQFGLALNYIKLYWIIPAALSILLIFFFIGFTNIFKVDNRHRITKITEKPIESQIEKNSESFTNTTIHEPSFSPAISISKLMFSRKKLKIANINDNNLLETYRQV